MAKPHGFGNWGSGEQKRLDILRFFFHKNNAILGLFTLKLEL